MFKQLTDPSLMRLHVQASDWENAVRQAAQPLVDQKKILPSYVEDIIAGVHEYGPYIVLMPHMALPHARPEAGALEDAIGICVLDTPVYFGNEANDPVKYLFCLSATDNRKHLDALVEMADILADPDFFPALDAAETTEDIMAYLTKHDL